MDWWLMVWGRGWNRKDASQRRESPATVRRREADMMKETRKVEIKMGTEELGRWPRG